MAVYYKWIKGCAPGATLDTKQWTYINWGDKSAFSSSDTNQTEALPKLYARIGKDDASVSTSGSAVALGYILTNNVKGVEVEPLWKFKAQPQFSSGIQIGLSTTGSVTHPTLTSSGSTLLVSSDTIFNSTAVSSVKMLGGLTIDKTITVNSTGDKSIYTKGSVSIDKNLDVKGNMTVTGNMAATGSCTALYFNATSDRRAKENIKPANYSALDLIKKLPIYNYNYKQQPHEHMTGILAQDLLIAQPSDLDLVSNINASGENGDFMSIKNDKLIFILMKAIQEQQEEIENLKDKIEKIKNL